MNRRPSSRSSAQNAGSSRMASTPPRAPMSAAMSVSGTYRPPNCGLLPHRPRSSGSRRPGSTGRGPKGSAGRSSRAARARLTNMATRTGSLGGRPSRRDAARRRPRYRHRLAGTARSASATFAAVEAAREDDRDARGHRGRDIGGGTAARATGHRRVGRVEQDGPQVGLRPIRLGTRHDLGRDAGPRRPVRRPRRRSARQVERLDDRQRDASSASGGSAPWSWTASSPMRAAMAATSSASRSAKMPTSRGPFPGAVCAARGAPGPPPRLRSGHASCPAPCSGRWHRRRPRWRPRGRAAR